MRAGPSEVSTILTAAISRTVAGQPWARRSQRVRAGRYNRSVQPEVRTLPDAFGEAEARQARRWRRLGLVGLTVLVVAGLSGLLDSRTTARGTDRGEVTLDVTHARVIRGGQPIPLHVTVTASDGFEQTVQLRLSRDLFDRLDFQNWYPTPSAETGDPDGVLYEFDPPDGDRFEVRLDARAQPNQFPAVVNEEFSVVDDAGTPLATVPFRVVVVP
jgi:hypothetical protein